MLRSCAVLVTVTALLATLGSAAAQGQAKSPVLKKPRPCGLQWGVVAVAFSRDSKTLATGTKEERVRLWEVSTGKELAVLNGHNDWVGSVAWSPDGTTLASSSGKMIKLWDAATRKELATLEEPEFWTGHIEWSPDSKTLASASDLFQSTVKFWDVATRKVLATHRVRDEEQERPDVNYVSGVAWSPDGKTLVVSGSWPMVWNVTDFTKPTAKVLMTPQKGKLTSGRHSPAWSPDGKTLAVCTETGIIELWDVAQRKKLTSFGGNRYQRSVRRHCVAWSPDCKMLASIGDGTVKLWQVATGKEIASQHLDSLGLTAVAWSGDGKTLAVARAQQQTQSTVNESVLLWDLYPEK